MMINVRNMLVISLRRHPPVCCGHQPGAARPGRAGSPTVNCSGLISVNMDE